MIHEQKRYVLQSDPDGPVQPCGCGSPFAIVRFSPTGGDLRCEDCGERSTVQVRFHDLDATRRSPGHLQCSRRRAVVPRVREEVGAQHALLGAERWDLFCVDCGQKDGMLAKGALLGHRPARRNDANAWQRPEVLARSGGRCEMCFTGPGVALDVGHCLSDADAKALGVAPDVSESLMNKCALCLPCNQACGGTSMPRSVFVGLSHTREENRKMLDVGPDAADPLFRAVFALLKKARELRRQKAGA